MAEKLSVLSGLGSVFNRWNFPLFSLKPFQVKCFEYLLRGKFLGCIILCKMGLTSPHDFKGSWHLYICRFLFGHPTFLSLYSFLWKALHVLFWEGILSRVEPFVICQMFSLKSAWFPLLSACRCVNALSRLISIARYVFKSPSICDAGPGCNKNCLQIQYQIVSDHRYHVCPRAVLLTSRKL